MQCVNTWTGAWNLIISPSGELIVIFYLPYIRFVGAASCDAGVLIQHVHSCSARACNGLSLLPLQAEV